MKTKLAVLIGLAVSMAAFADIQPLSPDPNQPGNLNIPTTQTPDTTSTGTGTVTSPGTTTIPDTTTTSPGGTMPPENNIPIPNNNQLPVGNKIPNEGTPNDIAPISPSMPPNNTNENPGP